MAARGLYEKFDPAGKGKKLITHRRGRVFTQTFVGVLDLGTVVSLRIENLPLLSIKTYM